jgi:hypothetical protein
MDRSDDDNASPPRDFRVLLVDHIQIFCNNASDGCAGMAGIDDEQDSFGLGECGLLGDKIWFDRIGVIEPRVGESCVIR